MVRTRAQRGKGLQTPSPKTKFANMTTNVSGNENTTENPNESVIVKSRKRRGGTESENKAKSSHQRLADKQLLTETPRGSSKLKPQCSERAVGSSSATRRCRQRSSSKHDASEDDEERDATEDSEVCCDEPQSPAERKGRTHDGEDAQRRMKAERNSTGKDLRDEEGDLGDGENRRMERTAGVTKRTLKQKSDLSDDDGSDDEEEEEEEEEDEEDDGNETKTDVPTVLSDSDGEKIRLGKKGEEEKKDEQGEEIDSDAPEDVSFSKSRQEALESISQALEQTRRSEERARARRRNRDKLLKEQKERKKIALHQSRLPDDFLSEISQLPSQQEKREVISDPGSTSRPQRQSSLGQHTVFESDEEASGDFIPFSPHAPRVVEGFEVHAISRQQRAPPPKSESALDFLQKQLYGAKIKRESVNKHQSRLLKRQGQPAMVFLNPKEKKRKVHREGSRVR